jgi:hypothetical protein
MLKRLMFAAMIFVMTAVHVSALEIVCCGESHAGAFCGICNPPPTIEQLAESADIVITGFVVTVEIENFHEPSVATVKITEVLKGNARVGETIQVQETELNMHSTGFLMEGRNYMMLLEKAKDSDFYRSSLGLIDIHRTDIVSMVREWFPDYKPVERDSRTAIMPSFSDVAPADWFYEDVNFAVENGLLGGTSPERFSPNRHVTRAMAIQIVYNHAGNPENCQWCCEEYALSGFVDVAQDAWYKDAAVWIINRGIIDIRGQRRFTEDGITIPGLYLAPYEYITREELIYMLHIYVASSPDLRDTELPIHRESRLFTDNDDITNYMREAVDRFYRAKIISGRPNGSFDPEGFVTRAELAVILSGFVKIAPPVQIVVPEPPQLILNITDTPEYYPLTINTANRRGRISPIYNAFWSRELTNEELFTAFPGFKRFNPADAEISYDGDKIDRISVMILRNDAPSFTPKAWINIWGVTENIELDYEPVISDVRGIPVNARAFRDGRDVHFSAHFILDDIQYMVYAPEDFRNGEYSQTLETLVNEIIRSNVIDGYKADLSVFENPNIPENLLEGRLTLEDAYADPDFGMYIPKNIPSDSFTRCRFRPEVQRTWGVLLISLECEIENNSLSWVVSEISSDFMDIIHENIVSPDEREKFDLSLFSTPWGAEAMGVLQSPVFRAEDLTFDLLKTRTFLCEQQGWLVWSLAVLLDNDIFLQVYSAGITPEQMWEMLESVI